MNRLVPLTLLLLTAQACAAREPNPAVIAPLITELERFGGPNARDCGMVAYGNDRTEAFSCAGRAEAGKGAYWVAVQVQGIDSQIWFVAIRTPSLERVLLQYDSDSSGGYDREPTRLFHYQKCQSFVLNAESAKPIVCAHGL